MSQEVEAKVRGFIIERFLFGQGGETLANEDSFLDKGLIDSTGILEVVSFLEEEFEIKIDDKELIPDNLDSVNRITAFVSKKQG